MPDSDVDVQLELRDNLTITAVETINTPKKVV
jgi:hypothetical protein